MYLNRAPFTFIQSVVDIGNKTSHTLILISHFDEYVCCSVLLRVLQNNHPNLIYF